MGRIRKLVGMLSLIGLLTLVQEASARVMWGSSPDPNDADLLMWLKADSLGLTDGANVTQWNDSSNKGHHMYGGFSGVGYPTFAKNVLSGLPAVRFNGTLKVLSNGNGANSVILNQEHTIIVVGHSKNSLNFNDSFFSYVPFAGGGVGQTSWIEMAIYRDSATHFRMRYIGLDTSGSTGNSALNSPAILGQVRSTTTNLRAYVNAITPLWLNITSTTVDFPTTNLVFRIGQFSNNSQYLNGDVFEVLVYNRALSVLELREVYDYLNAKWFGNPSPPAQVALEAQFNGSGSGTGGASDITTFGGTAVLFNDSGSNMSTPTFVSTTPLASTPTGTTGYMHLADSSSTAGTLNKSSGVKFTSASASNSPDSWYKNRGTTNFDLVNGGVDFLHRSNVASSNWIDKTFYPLDLDGGANGLRLYLKSAAANTLQVQLQAKNGSNAPTQTATANATVSFSANTTYHIAVTVTTNGAGQATVKLFTTPGNAPIETVTSTPAATGTSSGVFDAAGVNVVMHAFNATPTFRFGQVSNPTGNVQTDYDALRVFNGAPTRFEAFELLPDLLVAPAKPNPEPSYPAGFDANFVPPVGGAVAGTNPPVIAEWIRTGTAGDALMATGDKLTTFTPGADEGKDTCLMTYGQTSQGRLTSCASLYRLDGNKAAFGLDPALPKWSMYFLWPKNANGYGRPVAVNQTEAWWVGPSTATRGDTVSVYGRNLSHDNGTSTAWVYVKQITGGSFANFITPNAVNPYKVDFVLPTTGFNNGAYEVWAHNGHGRGCGWSGPLTLTVDNGFTWTGTTYDVTSYGANGGDANDDTAAVLNAITAANGTLNSTVYFPAGTYYITESLTPASNVRLHGAGKTSTSIVATSSTFGSHSTSAVMVQLYYPAVSNVEMSDLQLNAGTATASGSGNSLIVLFASPTNLRVKNVKITATQNSLQSPGYFRDGSRILFQDCDIAGQILQFMTCPQLFVDRCNFHGAYDQDCMYVICGCNESSITHCTGQDYDNTTTTGWGNGRFCYAGGGERNIYWGENTTKDLGVRPGFSNQNVGEQLLFDGGTRKFEGSPTSATSTTITFASLPDFTLLPNPGNPVHAVIIQGTGIGQLRTIASYNLNTLTLTVSPAWNVTPDATSVVALGNYQDKAVAYRNHLDGKDISRSCGIEPYSGTMNMVADTNTITDCASGIATTGFDDLPEFFGLFTNNLIHNSNQPFLVLASTDNAHPAASYVFGQVFRGNTVESAALSTGEISNGPGGAVNVDMVLFDRTVATNVPAGIKIGSTAPNYAGSVLLVGNTVDRGTATFSGSKGIDFSATGKPGLFGNAWPSFETTYASNVPGYIVELPQRTLTVTGKVGGSSQTTTFKIRHAGTNPNLPPPNNGNNTPLNWGTSITGSSWMTVVPPTSGTILDEKGEATVTLTCNPSVGAGIHTGTVYVTVAGVNQKAATVVFTVNP